MIVLWWLRSAVMSLFIPVWVILFGPWSILCHLIFKNRNLDNANIQVWAKLNCWTFGIRVQVIGAENIPAGGCLFLFNHSSFFDVFAIAGYIPGVRFGAKAELFKIPIFSQTMRIMGTIPIARQNRSEVYKVYEEAKVRFKNGEKFALSPEGGRHYGPQLAPFKAGPFIFAMSAEVPVVPLVLIGAYEALKKGQWIPNRDQALRTIQIHILKPVPTVGYAPDQRQKLQAIVYAEMNAIWEKPS